MIFSVFLRTLSLSPTMRIVIRSSQRRKKRNSRKRTLTTEKIESTSKLIEFVSAQSKKKS